MPLLHPQGDLDALRALQAALPPAEFWSPQVLGQIPEAAVDALLDDIASREPGLALRFEVAHGIRPLAAVARIEAMSECIRWGPHDETERRALAWAAGVPVEVVGKLQNRFLELGAWSTLTWLPDGLELDRVKASGSALKALPRQLKVRDLFLTSCRGLTTLPDDLEVDELYARNAGLESIPDGFHARVVELGFCEALRTLPDGLVVERLDVTRTGLEQLPHGLDVKFLTICGCSITKLPADLRVHVALDVKDSPLEGMSNEEIWAMAPGVRQVWR